MSLIVFIGSELGGDDPRNHSLNALAAVYVHNGKVVQESLWLLWNDVYRLGPKEIQTFGRKLAERDQAGTVSFKEGLKEFESVLNSALLQARKSNVKVRIGGVKLAPQLRHLEHHSQDDRMLLLRTHLWDFDQLDLATIAALWTDAGIVSVVGQQSPFEALCGHFGVSVQLHDALSEARACAQVYLTLCSHLGLRDAL